MEHTPPPDPIDPRLPSIYEVAADILPAILPRPVPDTPEALAQRDRIAFAAFTALAPANLAEADVAIHHLALMAHAGECLREAVVYETDPRFAARLRSQGGSMERQARACLKMLLDMQKVRAKREANPVTRDADKRLQKQVYARLTEALDHLQATGQLGAPAPLGAAKAEPEPAPERPGPSRPSDPAGDMQPQGARIIPWPKVPVDRTIH
jgi:hypothetical protein